MHNDKQEWKYFHNLINAFCTKSEPVQITHFVTEKCNAQCPHCFVNTNQNKLELSLEQIEKISSTSGKSLRNVALTGGEPFLRNDIFEIANIWYKNSTAKTVTLCTNGSMPDKIEKFAQNANKYDIPVSFFFSYDFIEEKHSEFRKIKDLHINVLESCKIVQQYYPKFNATFNITINKDNYSTAYETYKYMRDKLNIQNINCTLVRGENTKLLSNEEKQSIAEVYELIHKEHDKDFNDKKIRGYSDTSLTNILLNAKNKIIWKYVLQTFKESKYFSPCCAGALFGVIYSNGNVFPCELLNNGAGNLKDFDYDFLALWQSENAKIIRNNIVKSKCYCTFECTWLLNIFSSPRYFLEIIYHIINNSKRNFKK